MDTKKCSKCGQELPATNEYFFSTKKNKDGFFGQCKLCVAEYQKQYRTNNKEYIAKCKKQYRAEHKGPTDERNKQYRAANKERLREHDRQYRKQYYVTNKERITERDKQWKKNHPELRRIADQRREARKRQLPATLTREQWQVIMDCFNNKCAYCGKKKPLEQDHFIPLSKGGGYTHNNIIPACGSCNASKRDRDFKEWYPSQEFYSKRREKKILSFLGYTEHGEQQPALMI